MTLDGSNIFNLPELGRIKVTLTKLPMSIESYFSERHFFGTIRTGEYLMTASIPQKTAGVSEDPLMSMMYMIGYLTGFSEDLVVFTVGKYHKGMELYGNENIHIIKSWLRMCKLYLKEQMTVFIANCRKTKPALYFQSILRSLGVEMDAKLSFKRYFDYTQEEPAKAYASPTVGNAGNRRRGEFGISVIAL